MSKDIFIQLTHDLDFLIEFQQKIVKECRIQGVPDDLINTAEDILTILEAMKESGLLVHLPKTKES